MPIELAAAVDQRAARVAGIDRRVGLDEILVLRDADVGAAERADDAERHRLVERERIADGHHPFGDLQLRRIAPRNHRQAGRVDLEQRRGRSTNRRR